MPKVDLVPIRVKIRYGLKDGRLQHIYPDFNALAPILRGDMDWSMFFDAHGIGWHYDSLSGIGEVDVVNPDPDVWHGCTCVPKDFADAAVALFPNDVENMTEAQFEDFYDNRAHINLPDELLDKEVLDLIAAKRSVGIQDTAETLKALDPDDPTPGIRKNIMKKWTTSKVKLGVKIAAEFEKQAEGSGLGS